MCKSHTDTATRPLAYSRKIKTRLHLNTHSLIRLSITLCCAQIFVRYFFFIALPHIFGDLFLLFEALKKSQYQFLRLKLCMKLKFLSEFKNQISKLWFLFHYLQTKHTLSFWYWATIIKMQIVLKIAIDFLRCFYQLIEIEKFDRRVFINRKSYAIFFSNTFQRVHFLTHTQILSKINSNIKIIRIASWKLEMILLWNRTVQFYF